MSTFRLKIVTPDGLKYEGEVEKLVVRTTSGDAAILARHANYVAPLGMGEAQVFFGGSVRIGACIGGMVSVMDSQVSLLPMTFEWAEDIDTDRAAASERRAQDILEKRNADEQQILLAKARLKRALVRQSAAAHSGK